MKKPPKNNITQGTEYPFQSSSLDGESTACTRFALEKTGKNGIKIRPRLLTDKQSAEYLGISRSYVREYVHRGMLRRVLLPHPSGVGYIHRLLISIDELDRFIEKHMEQVRVQ